MSEAAMRARMRRRMRDSEMGWQIQAPDYTGAPCPQSVYGQPMANPSPIEALPDHMAQVGDDMSVRRALPHRLRRRVGAWCFLDHYGPVTLAPEAGGMRVGPHPHMGLQTVSWLYAGEVFHRDSLGSKQLIRPGQL